jgi:hypothetical protein
MRTLIRPDVGELVVETEPEDIHENYVVTFEGGGPPFGWTRIGAEALVRVAAPLGFRVSDRWSAGGRRFIGLVTCFPGTDI